MIHALAEGREEGRDPHPHHAREEEPATADPVREGKHEDQSGYRAEPHERNHLGHLRLVEAEVLTDVLDGGRQGRDVVALEEQRERDQSDQANVTALELRGETPEEGRNPPGLLQRGSRCAGGCWGFRWQTAARGIGAHECSTLAARLFGVQASGSSSSTLRRRHRKGDGRREAIRRSLVEWQRLEATRSPHPRPPSPASTAAGCGAPLGD